MAKELIINPDLGLIRSIRKAGGDTVKKCYQCATCAVVCNLSPDNKPFPRKEMLMAQWGQKDQLVTDPDIWMCHQCNDCSTYCPRGARPGDVLAAIRTYIYKNFAFPSFMGAALASPATLPFLFFLPVIILMACIYSFAPRIEDGSYLFLQAGQSIDFNIFLPHSSVDALFVFGNILIFLFASIGFMRFWRSLHQGNPEIKMSFIPALIATLKEFIFHKLFKKCDVNHARATAHMILFLGFLGAMITTGLVFIFIFIPHYLNMLGLESMHSFFDLPLAPYHPVKIIGALSGIGLTVGGAWMILRRMANKDQIGANGYPDYLFLYVVFFAGFTGMLAWLIRVADLALASYIMYFIHLTFVYFLLWYMPYSKFAHMFYRTLALVYCRQIGRVTRN